MALLTFNSLLEAAGVSPGSVYLLRQRDTRMKRGQTLYRLWRFQPEEFRRYERFQAKQRFAEGNYTASFVIDPDGDALFAGLSLVTSAKRNSHLVRFEYLDEEYPPGTLHEYELDLDNRFLGFEGRLVIDWGPGTRSWCQRAHRQPKPIVELRRTIVEVEWPGFLNVRITDEEVTGLAQNWKARLSAANGVYLLTCTESGEQYVGAAYGADGFLGRWFAYSNGGDGGNKLLRAHRKQTSAPMQISVLEVFGSAMTEEDSYAAESRWKLALGSRAHGLNAN